MVKGVAWGAGLLVVVLAGFVGFSRFRPPPGPAPGAPARAVRAPDAGQIVAVPEPPPVPVVEPPARDGGVPAQQVGGVCPSGMVHVRGRYCTEVEAECLEWAANSNLRCLHFRRPTRCDGRRRALSFCMDEYEWPNRAGARPEVMVTWHEAQARCRTVGRRLCTEDEWTFACEGEAMDPYPYGYDRDPTACNIDRRFPAPVRSRLHGPGGRAEAERVYTAVPSGALARCVSPTGVHDLAGNVDEWTVSSSGRPFRSALKGGWWGFVRTRCRPVTRAHNETFRYYQIGFRCCADAR